MKCFIDFAAESDIERAGSFSSRLWQFMLIFALIGLVQSVDLPNLIAVMGNWTNRANRGKITGLWSTCQSGGNILGL